SDNMLTLLVAGSSETTTIVSVFVAPVSPGRRSMPISKKFTRSLPFQRAGGASCAAGRPAAIGDWTGSGALAAEPEEFSFTGALSRPLGLLCARASTGAAG